MTKEHFFEIVNLPTGVTESYFIINGNVWFIDGMKTSNTRNEFFTIAEGDDIFEKYFYKVNEIDLIQEILKSWRFIINSTNEKIAELIEMLEKEYQENILALESELSTRQPIR